jgi:serine/threonine protein kinase
MTALVMELIEGPTLADRILRGPTSIDEALALAKQVASALEAAHEQGIVHRDLKPANVKVKADGSIKVLDFGLAKALESPASPADLSQSPTMSAVATRAGVILGTTAYMSPEQARGHAIDKRTDIWAFGCGLYEMLTGHEHSLARRSPTRLRRFSSGSPTGRTCRQPRRGACGDYCNAAWRKMRDRISQRADVATGRTRAVLRDRRPYAHGGERDTEERRVVRILFAFAPVPSRAHYGRSQTNLRSECGRTAISGPGSGGARPATGDQPYPQLETLEPSLCFR